MTKDEALRMALEALKQIDEAMPFPVAKLAQASIKEALAQPEQDGQCKRCIDGCPACDARKLPEQEPVAWGVFEGNLHDMFFSPSEAQEMADLKGTHAEVRPLYTTPPQRKPMMDEDVERIVREARVGERGIGYTIARAIEAAHNIKE